MGGELGGDGVVAVSGLLRRVLDAPTRIQQNAEGFEGQPGVAAVADRDGSAELRGRGGAGSLDIHADVVLDVRIRERGIPGLRVDGTPEEGQVTGRIADACPLPVD